MPLNNFGFLFNDSPNPMWIYALPSLRIIKVNKAAINHYGYTENDFLNMAVTDLQPAGQQDYGQPNPALLSSEANKPGIWKHQKANGDIIYSEIVRNKVKFEGQDCHIAVAIDVTEKIHFQEELIRTKHSLEA